MISSFLLKIAVMYLLKILNLLQIRNLDHQKTNKHIYKQKLTSNLTNFTDISFNLCAEYAAKILFVELDFFLQEIPLLCYAVFQKILVKIKKNKCFFCFTFNAMYIYIFRVYVKNIRSLFYCLYIFLSFAFLTLTTCLFMK